MIPRDLLKAPFEVVQAYLNAACEFIVSQPNYVPSVEPIEITPEADAKARETIGKKFSGQNPGESRGFCPTGKGGGIDNSCSSKDGGGGGPDLAVGDSLKRSDVKVGQTISVQKHGQNKVHNGVVIGVKHEDAVSEITIKDAGGNETTIRIRNLAKIREANLGDESQVREPASPKEPKQKGKLEAPKRPELNTAETRAEYRQAVKDFCASHGVQVTEALKMGGSSIDSMHEVASGVSRLVAAGQPLPSRIVMTNRLSDGSRMGNAMGFYTGGSPDTIYVSTRVPPGEPKGSIDSGFLAGSSASGPGTIVIHENGHRLHHKSIGDREFERLPRIPPRGGTTLSYKDHQTAGRVSRYAQTCEAEFVAETYSGHIAGQRYPDEVYETYNRFGGPRLPGVKRTKSGKIKIKN